MNNKNFKAVRELVDFVITNLSKVVEIKKANFYEDGYDYEKDNYKFRVVVNEFDFENLQTNPMLKISIKDITEKIDGFIVSLIPTLSVTCAEEISKSSILFVSKKEIERYVTDTDYCRGFTSIPLKELRYKKVDYRVLNFDPSKVEIPLSKMIKKDENVKVKYTSFSVSAIQDNADSYNINNLRLINISNITPNEKEYEKLMLVMENKKYFSIENVE